MTMYVHLLTLSPEAIIKFFIAFNEYLTSLTSVKKGSLILIAYTQSKVVSSLVILGLTPVGI